MTAVRFEADALSHRLACETHLIRRARERKLGLSREDLDRWRDKIRAARPAFEKEGVGRYRLKLNAGRRRYFVIYDRELDCLVSVWCRN
jgi:hypothetical protein